MPIFKISGQKISKIEPTSFKGYDSEKKLQTLIENNLATVFEMTFIDTEFPTTHGGRIDTLAIDSDNRPVIIEYKADKSSTVLLQGLYYMDWIVENKAEFEKLVKQSLKKEIAINWKSGVRLILIAKAFEIWDKFAVNRIKEEVELYEYTLYQNQEIKLEKTALPKDFKGTSKTSITSIKEFSVEDKIVRIKSDKIKAMVNELRDKIKLIADNIVERATKGHIVYRSTINFLAIYPQAKQFWIGIRLPQDKIKNQFKKLDVRPHKDKVFSHIRCNEDTDLLMVSK